MFIFQILNDRIYNYILFDTIVNLWSICWIKWNQIHKTKTQNTGSVIANCFFFDLGLTDRIIEFRFFSKIDLESRNLRKFASTTIFYESHNVCLINSPIWKNAKKNYGKKILNASIVKTFPNLKFNVYCIFLMPFCFNI